MASYQEGSSLEFCLGHKREQSQDSGAYIDWNSEDSASPVNNADAGPSDDFITVVAVENGGGNGDDKGIENNKKDEASFVTILAIGDTDEASGNIKDVEEEVLVYRLPGERLGFGLKFEGGTNTAENVKRLFIQSSAPDSPASRVKCSWGTLVEGDEILKIDGNVVKNMTRLDCVRCLKESSVVIKLYVRHKRQKKGQSSSRIRVENVTSSVSSSSPTVVSAEMKKNIPPPPPVPPRKIIKKSPKETSVNPPEGFSDSPNEVSGPMPKTRTIQNSCSDEVSKNSSKFVIRVPQKTGDNSPEMSNHSFKRNGSDFKIAPPEPKVYLDLLAQEETRNGESESDDTCSTVSTVVGLSSMPTTTNSSFSDLRSSASSFCDSTNPSAPNSEPTTPVLDLSRMLPPFDHLQNNDFLFSKLINGKEQENINYEDKNSTNVDDMIALQPPLNFQDAPLSYGNEEMRTTITENLTMFQEEPHEGLQEVSYDLDHPSEDGKLRDKLTKDSKKPSLIPRLAKSIGLLSPPKPSPRKEPKLQEGNKSRFHKRKPPPPPLFNGNGPLENETKTLKSSIPYLKKKKNKNEDFKKAGKKETPFKMDEMNVKQELMSASDAAVSNVEDMIEMAADEVTVEKEALESPETNRKLTWEVPNLKNFIENTSGTNENGHEDLKNQDNENIQGIHHQVISQRRDDGDNGIDVDGNSDSQYMFLWSGSKHLETIGEDEEEITADEMALKSFSGDMGLENTANEEKIDEGESRRSEVQDNEGNDSMIIKEERDKINLENTKRPMENSGENEKNWNLIPDTTSGVEKKSDEFDESETTGSKHPNTLCSSHVLVKLDNDPLEAVKKAVDLNDSNGDLKEAMVPVVSTAVGLVASTSTFRMPPDGHEFPQKYSEKVHGDPTPSVKMTNGLQSDEVDAGLPPLPSSEPPSVLQNKFLSPIFNDVDEELHAAMRKTESAAIPKSPRNSFWRQDEKSEKSVRDKIAMFSSVPDSGPGSGPNLSKYKSSDDVFYSEEPECNRNIQNGKLFSRSVMTLDKVTGSVNPYAKKHSFGDGPMPPRSLDYTNRTQSSVDLSCSSSSAYSSSCSPDSSLSSNSSSYLGYSSTLPRKKTRNEDNKTEKKEPAVHRTTSFSVHGRSQSLLDMNPTSYRSRYLSEGFSEEGNRKSGALNFLMEQRRKNLTKLRGLVIPEKLGDSTPTDPIVDLPEIRSRDSILNSKVSHAYKEKNVPQKWSKSTLPEVTEPKVTPTHLWDMQNKTPNIPKYSPAFKRKSISVFGGKEPLSLNIKKDISVTPLTKSEPAKVPVKPPRNLPLVRQNSVCDDRKYQDAFTSNLCETEIGFPGEKAQMMKSTDYVPKRKPILQGRYRLHSDMGRSEEDSDNDSAVSSSRSSISHGFSPPASPLLGNQYQDVDDPGQRSGCPLSPDRITLTRSMLAPSGATCRDADASNKRILKPQSVEAINRKNVLTSAKFSRGFDLKSGSPLIQRRFSKEMGENGVNNPDFPNTLNQALSSGNKYAKDSPYKGKIEKIAYITDVVDGTVEPEEIRKKKVERSESVPLPIDTRVTTRKASVPLEYSWASEDSWSKSFEQVPINLKESLNSRSSFDKSDGKSSVLADKDFSFSNLKIRNGKSLTSGTVDPLLSASNDLTTVEKVEKSHLEPKGARGTTEKVVPNFSSRSVSVNDIRRTFEKADSAVPSPVGRTVKTGNGTGTSSVSPQNGVNGNHTRMSSLDSTTSDDGPYGYSSNLLREQFGSITSLASSTSLISPQELQILIEEANQTLEESGNINGGSSSNNHDVLVLILHRDTVGGSIGITLAGGADYESKEITVHKVLAGSPADRDGRIQKGDRILSINGKSMKGVTHRESLAILKSPRLEVVLVVSRLKGDANPDIGNSDDSTSLQTRSSSSRPPRIYERSTLMESDELSISDAIKGPPVTLHLVKDGAGLGFSLEGGKDCSTGDRPLVIKKIFTGGVAEKCGQLKAGDELLNINGIDVSVMSRIDAWKLMKRLPDGNVTITVKRQVQDDDSKKCHGYVTKP